MSTYDLNVTTIFAFQNKVKVSVKKLENVWSN